MFLVCVIMRRMYPLQDFDVWFRKSGKKLLAAAKAADAKEDLEDELLGEGEEVDDEVIGPDEAGESLDDDPMVVLTAVSDHLKQKSELQQLADAIDKGAPIGDAAKSGDDQIAPQENLQMELPGDPKQCQLIPADPDDVSDSTTSTTFHKLMAACKDDPLFDMGAEESRFAKACRKRQMFLMPLMRTFASAVRLREQHLSTTSILGKDAVKMSKYHELHRELARARNASLSDGMRQSRARNWQLTQQACLEALDDNTAGSDWQVRAPERLRCGGSDGCDGKGCQVVVFRSHDEDWFLKLCCQSSSCESKTVAHL